MLVTDSFTATVDTHIKVTLEMSHYTSVFDDLSAFNTISTVLCLLATLNSLLCLWTAHPIWDQHVLNHEQTMQDFVWKSLAQIMPDTTVSALVRLRSRPRVAALFCHWR